MGGTERTKILTGPAPTRTVKVRSGLFRSHEREDPDDERQPYVMGWAFVTAAGDGWEPTYSTYTPTDEYGRRGATAAEIMAVDVTGQLWFVKTGEMPKRIGLVDVATVVAYGLYTEKWNGKALPLLCRCTYVHSPYLDRPPHSNAPQVVQDEYKAKLAAWDAKVAKVDKILALGLGAALEDAGR
jgi:hypothetical protein